MQPSDPGPVSGERPLPKAEDFPRTGPFSLAAPGPRFGARAIDLAVIALPALVVVGVTSKTVAGQFQLDVPSWLLPALALLGCLYEFASVAWLARTPGKWMLGLRIARYTDGKKPTAAQALLRALLPWSVLALPLGPFAVAAFLGVYGSGIGGGDLHRGLPDQAGGTLVISTR
jgi:uncharacterized RDD family membrane protein YckC